MKFKLVFVAFNVIILLSFLFVFLLPYFFLGWEYTRVFWVGNWYLAAVFVIIIVVLNLYFARNWKLFGLLENENWPVLVEHLEREIFQRKRVSRQFVRLLVNAYVVVSKPEMIGRLEQFLRAERPRLIPEFAVELGVPHLLSNDGEKISAYFGERARDAKTRNRGWVQWSHGFGLMLKGEHEAAKQAFLNLLNDARDPVLKVLTAYMLDSYRRHDAEAARRVQEELNRVRNSLSVQRWQKQLERSRSNLLVLVMSRLLQDASAWAFPDWYPCDPAASDEGTKSAEALNDDKESSPR